MADYSEYVYELPGSIKNREFPDQLMDYNLLRQDCAPWSSFKENGLQSHLTLTATEEYESVSKSFRTGRLGREIQMVQLPLDAVVSLFCESV